MSLLSVVPAATEAASAATTQGSGSPLVPVYVVRSSWQGAPENLDEIARRFLGDAGASAEVAALNGDIVQQDGGRVRLGGSLRAGWVILLPDRAEGSGLRVAQVGSTTTAAEPTDWWPILLGAGAALLVLAIAAAAWALVWRRRRPNDPQPARGPTVAGDRDAWLIDRALRVMLTRSSAEDLRAGTPYLIAVDQERVVLHLTAPRSTAPLPFRASESATEWSASIREVQDTSVDPATPNRASTTVVVGEVDGTLHAIDLGLADGVVQVVGDPARRRALIADWGRQLRNAPWADTSLPIFASGFAAGAIAESRYVDSVSAVQDELTAGGPVVLLVDGLDRRDEGALDLVLSTPGAPRAVVVGGDFATPRWVIEVADDGVVRSELFQSAVDTQVAAG